MPKTKEEQRQYSKEYFLFKIDKEEFADNSSDSEDELNNSIYEGETDENISDEELDEEIDEEISSEEELDEECSSLNESSENKPSENKPFQNKIIKLTFKSSTLDIQKDKMNGHFSIKNKIIKKKGTQTNN